MIHHTLNTILVYASMFPFTGGIEWRIHFKCAQHKGPFP
jgi:hypothetical protein